MLNKLQVSILQAIKERDFNYGPKITINSFEYTETEGTERKYEAAYNLSSLKNLDMVEFDGEVITPSGKRHPKFGNSVHMISWDRVHIRPNGIEYLNKYL